MKGSKHREEDGTTGEEAMKRSPGSDVGMIALAQRQPEREDIESADAWESAGSGMSGPSGIPSVALRTSRDVPATVSRSRGVGLGSTTITTPFVLCFVSMTSEAVFVASG